MVLLFLTDTYDEADEFVQTVGNIAAECSTLPDKSMTAKEIASLNVTSDGGLNKRKRVLSKKVSENAETAALMVELDKFR